ncbi:ABC transporter ATP-binding protein [Desulfosarcina ovata]|uniref:Macrolide export ATP-binding/permease protein MacB n=1 Tax=Desulfosarcina ovata subsp. ovata TaxID=2752305 RepID=A0A5K8AIE8_9BACT|nr:ABC transporter ATP-binding protein [Desulfosarcina ovata]BBO92462.1 macrolide export ATP-binding/permease protein MacB [Desulfosarcina ovata subsp. ovata]
MMIRLEGISKLYGVPPQEMRALSGVDLSIDAGEYVAIMGTSGSGKSTLLNILGCLDHPTEGHYLLAERDVSTLDDTALSKVRNEVLGFVFQQFHLLPRLSVIKNVLLPLIYAPEYPSDALEKGTAALSSVGLENKLAAKPGELSGGQQQRVAIARALINEPSILLADEPTGNLDKQSGREILDIFKKLNRDGRTVIMVTHDSEVAKESGRVVVIEDGRIVSDQRGLHARGERS